MMIDPKLDLVLERVLDVPPDLVWMAWTQPEHLKKWFTPAPWTTADCEIDLRPGGVFRRVLQGPAGERMTNVGCYLEVVPGKKLVWTDELEAGFRPTTHESNLPFGFTATITIEPHEKGTRYTAVVMHADAKSRDQHNEMGFADGWSTALDQLVAHVKSLR